MVYVCGPLKVISNQETKVSRSPKTADTLKSLFPACAFTLHTVLWVIPILPL